jgi:hypothetical protein
MSILDRVTRAVGDVVDRGKKEVDQFVRIQRINGQIGDLEKSIQESRGQIQQTKEKIGEIAIEMLRAGTLASQDMQILLDQITGIERQISVRETEITQKKAEIEVIRSEDTKPLASPPAPATPDTQTPPIPPPPPPVSRICQQCGAPAASGAFCAQCGSKFA